MSFSNGGGFGGGMGMGMGQSGQSGGWSQSGGQPDTKMLMQQIQQLQKTVMQLQANSSMGGGGGGGGGVLGSGPMGGGNNDFGGGFGGGGNPGGFGGGRYGANAGFGGGYSVQSGGGGGYGSGGGMGMHQRGGGGPRQPRREVKDGDDDQSEINTEDQRVLLVSNIPMNLSFPDSIYFAFEKFGTVERVKILHNKRNTALVQMGSAAEAKRAVNEQATLNKTGTDIYVNFSSKFREVKMPDSGSAHDDGLTKDYTGAFPNQRQAPRSDRMGMDNFQPSPMQSGPYPGMGGPAGGMGGMGGMGMPIGGGVMEMGGLLGMGGGPMGGMGQHMRGGGVGQMGGGGGGNYGQEGNNYGGGGGGGSMMGSGMMMGDMARGQGGVVLLVSNLPDEVANVGAIFNMFGAYGDVVCVKILKNKRDCALVQMAKPHHAQQVRNNLDQAKIGGNKLCISNSRVENLLSKRIDEDDELQKDFSHSRQHRFRNMEKAAKLSRNLGPPTSVLHIANIPEGLSHHEIKSMFIERGFTVKESKECAGNSSMCYLCMDSPDEALLALAQMHNFAPEEFKFKNANGICVSFSGKKN